MEVQLGDILASTKLNMLEFHFVGDFILTDIVLLRIFGLASFHKSFFFLFYFSEGMCQRPSKYNHVVSNHV